LAIASRGLVRLIDRTAYSNAEHSTVGLTGSRLSTVNKNSALWPFCIVVRAFAMVFDQRLPDIGLTVGQSVADSLRSGLLKSVDIFVHPGADTERESGRKTELMG
jgi:hypothetical protein